MYEIKPLVWENERYGDIEDKYSAYTTFGHYTVELVSGKWYVSYYFVEYHDEGCIGEADFLGKAKELASEHWKERLEETLAKVFGSV